MKSLLPAEFLTVRDTHPLVDVRTPGEFAEGHIPGALNIPIFSDEERAIIGTLYRQEGPVAAVDQGFELVGPRMKALAQAARAAAPGGQLAVYCWRGGMRSNHMAWLFEAAGIGCSLLAGGYKAYRGFAREYIDQLRDLRVLAGSTGSGKTALLHALAGQGEQVLDLEGLAKHRGSAFGGLGLPDQPTTEQYQSRVFEALYALDPRRRIWVESESKSIGRVYLPEGLWERMNQSPVVTIEVAHAVRVQRILDEYGSFPLDQLADTVRRIEKRLGAGKLQQCLDHLAEGQVAETIEILLGYYDASYAKGRARHKTQAEQVIVLGGDDVQAWARTLLASLDEGRA
jgi:tRNA 2-selenouridine synthase